jgi:hypothetical protein
VSVKEDGSMKFMWIRKYMVLKDKILEFNKNEVCYAWARNMMWT